MEGTRVWRGQEYGGDKGITWTWVEKEQGYGREMSMEGTMVWRGHVYGMDNGMEGNVYGRDMCMEETRAWMWTWD